jgi:hypothetical protein
MKTRVGLMKWILYILTIICLIISGEVSGQHFIGKHKTEVMDLMGREMKQLYEDENSVNRVYNTIKYIDRLGDQTLLFVFSEQDTCLYSKWMCDYSMLNSVMAKLNGKYSQSAEDTWSYVHDQEPYIITLTTGEWFFTITTKKEQKKIID